MRHLVAAVTVYALAGTVASAAAPVLRSADVTVAKMSARSCEVTMRLSVEGAEEIDHRIDSTNVDLIEVTGAQIAGDRAIGRTRSLVLRPIDRFYQFRYNARQAPREYRCPLWLPAIPTDGQSLAVAIHVEIPAGAQPPSESMPRLTWHERRGEVTLGHLPVFVHVPFTPDGVSASWSVSRTMDALAIGIVVVASAVWVWWKTRRRVEKEHT